MMLKMTLEAGDRIFEWRNKMAQTAMATVERLFNELEACDPEHIAEVVEKMLGPDERTSRYYYRVPWDDNDKPRVRRTRSCYTI